MRAGRALALFVLFIGLPVPVFLLASELGLRVIYRDAGKRTLGGPGGRSFEHLALDGDSQRGRLDVGPKTPGVPRIMIVGDSITWGLGVYDWRNLWPERLATALERAGARHEMAVFALPGRDVKEHLDLMVPELPTVQPDVFIYQWYVNDIELAAVRPVNRRWWQALRSHTWLLEHSYLYFYVDNRLATLLPPPNRSYQQYLVEDFLPGSVQWAEFERYAHALLTRAMEVATTRLLVLYPQVPFREVSPLKPIYDRLEQMAGPHRVTIPPATWTRWTGPLVERADARWQQMMTVSVASRGTVIETREYYMPAGFSDVVVTIAVPSGTAHTAEAAEAAIGSVEYVDPSTNQVIATAPIQLPDARGWQDVTVRMMVSDHGRNVRLRLTSAGVRAFDLAAVDLLVDYGVRVVNLTEPLNAIDTHASLFDSHPNERAHQVIADKVFEALIATAVPPRPSRP